MRNAKYYHFIMDVTKELITLSQYFSLTITIYWRECRPQLNQIDQEYLHHGWVCLGIATPMVQIPHPLADLGGCAGHMPPLMRPNSFAFACIFTKKCPHWRFMPPNGCTPPTGNPGSATATASAQCL